MSAFALFRSRIESALAPRFPSALTPPVRAIRPVEPTGIPALDELLQGGLPVGALSEMTGLECSGRTSAALSFLAQSTSSGKICAWIDASNAFHPASAASVGVDLQRLLWVRCGAEDAASVQETRRFVLPETCFAPKAVVQGLHGGGHGTHPRSEGKGLSAAVDRFLCDTASASRCAEPIAKRRPAARQFEPSLTAATAVLRAPRRARIYDALEQALRSTDLLIQTGGFSAIVLDLGSVQPEYVARIELSTWHRYRLAAEQMQASIVLLSQYPCAKSSAELQLQFHALEGSHGERTVLSGFNARVAVRRQRFLMETANVVPLRKPPQPEREAYWKQSAHWAAPR